MEIHKMKFTFCISLLAILLCTSGIVAQSRKDSLPGSNCCAIMKNGQMMNMKSGKMELMDQDMVLKNGTKCMANGECITQQGEKMIMKEGECIDIYGNISTCASMQNDFAPGIKSKENSKTTILFTCPKHPEIEDDKPGVCPKCGTELVEKPMK